MTEGNHTPPDLAYLVRKLLATGVGALRNRGELITLELQEEKARLVELLFWGFLAVFLAAIAIVMLTATIVLLCPPEVRVYVTAGFCVLYLTGAVAAIFSVKSLIKNEPKPFCGTIAEINRDRLWLESLK